MTDAAGAPPRVEAVAYTMLYEHRLAALGRAFVAAGLAPVIVKGQAVADMAYPAGEPRVASDVDLLVGEDEAAVAACLEGLGYRETVAHDRPYSREFLGERPFFTQDGALPPLVEVHRFLDKIIRRPIDYAGIIGRARPAGRPGFRYPTMEDLLLLVVLHASLSQIPDPKNQVDVRYLIERGTTDMEVVRERAAAWGLRRAVGVLLGTPESPDGWALGLAAGVALEISSWPFLPRTPRYLARQFEWHDNPHRWIRELTRYAWARARDRI